MSSRSARNSRSFPMLLLLMGLPLLLLYVFRPTRPTGSDDPRLPAPELFIHYYPGGTAKDVGALIVSLHRGGTEFFRMPRRFWRSSFTLLINGREGPPLALQAVRSPPESLLRFARHERFRFVYRLSPGAIRPGDTVQGRLRYSTAASDSRPVSAPPYPNSTAAQAENRALTASVLGDAARLFAAAEHLIKEAPERASGYWYLGLAEELRGHPAQALAAYAQAFGRDTIREGEVPAYALFKRFSTLSERLGKRQAK